MRMIAHSYDSYDHAVRAVKALETAGVPQDDISLVSGDKDREIGTTVAGDTAENTGTGAGTGATIGTMLGGGAGLLAGLGMLAIPGVGPVVAAGWLIATVAGAGVGAAAGGLLGSLTGAGIDEADAKTYAEHVGRGGTLVTVRADDAMAPEIEYILEHSEVRTGLLAETAAKAPASHPVTAATATSTAPTARSTGASTTDDSTIQLVRENLVVGKRAVEGGGVRVSTHVVETPVEEQVLLREENVRVERRPINRPLTGVGADAFRERTLTASAMREEAVVGKETRVVEEIALHKEANERVETVRDTVRETKVDVEQVPGSATTTRSTTGGGVPQDGSLLDNAATRAVDRNLDTNLSGENPGHKI